MTFRYHIVDVFTQAALEGNALAVFVDAAGLDARTMQRIARELNLSETVFIFPPDDERAVARVRIFAPSKEMDFAGHPTIGAAFVMRQINLTQGNPREFALQENVGLVSVRVGDGADPILWLTTPAISVGDVYDPAQCAAALGLRPEDLLPGLPCQLLSAGSPFVFVPLQDTDKVDRIAVDTAALSDLFRHQAMGLFAFAPTPGGAYSRVFAPALGIPEDPATGSATGPLAAYMVRHGLVATPADARFISEQGTRMGRRSFLHVLVHVERGAQSIEVGGNVVPVAVGEFSVASQLIGAGV